MAEIQTLIQAPSPVRRARASMQSAKAALTAEVDKLKGGLAKVRKDAKERQVMAKVEAGVMPILGGELAGQLEGRYYVGESGDDGLGMDITAPAAGAAVIAAGFAVKGPGSVSMVALGAGMIGGTLAIRRALKRAELTQTFRTVMAAKAEEG